MVTDLHRVERVERAHPALLVTRQLMDYLLRSDQISVGDRLPSERILAETFGVGRSAVREALKSLSLLGLLEIRQGDGTYLRNASSALLPQVLEWGLLLDQQSSSGLMDARRVVEVGLAGLAAQRRTDEDLAALEVELEGMEANRDDPVKWLDYDVAFHLRLADAAHSETLSDYLHRLRALLSTSVRHNQASSHDSDQKYLEHKRVYDAVREGDEQAARDAMSAHMENVAYRLTLAVEG